MLQRFFQFEVVIRYLSDDILIFSRQRELRIGVFQQGFEMDMQILYRIRVEGLKVEFVFLEKRFKNNRG